MRTLKLAFIIPLIYLAACLTFASLAYGFDIVKVTDTPIASEHDYSIAIFGNTIYAIWRDVINSTLHFDKSEDLGRTWGQHVKDIGFSGGYNQEYRTYPNKILINKTGNLFVLYKDRDYLYLLKSTDDGENFIECGEVPLIVPGEQFDFAIDETGAIIYIVGASVGSDQGNNIYFSKSTDGGYSFSSPQLIFSIIPNSEIQVQTSKDGKEIYLFLVNYHQFIMSGERAWRSRVDFSRSLDSGANFDALRGIIAEWPGLDASYRHWASKINAAMDRSAGKIYVSWTFKPNWNVTPFVVLSTSANQGTTFTHTRFNDSTNGADKSSVFVDGLGNIYDVFLKGLYSKVGSDYMFRSANVYFDKKLGGGAFGTDALIKGPLTIVDTSTNAIDQVSKPTIAVTPNGHAACAVWSYVQPGELNRDLYCSPFFVINKPPVINPAIGSKTVSEGQTLNFTIAANDPDNDTLTYSATVLPAGATIDPKTGSFSWTPDYTTARTAVYVYVSIKFIVSDGVATDYEIVRVKVNNVNRPPVLEPIGNRSVNEVSLLSFTVKANDPDTATDGQKLTYSAVNLTPGATSTALPTGARINATTGLFTWTPTYKQVGNYTIKFAATDPLKVAAVETIEITVNDVFFPDLTIVGPVTYTPASPKAGQTVTFKATIANNGNEIADAFTVRFFSDPIDAPIAPDLVNKSISSLAAGKTIIVSVTWKAKVGTHTPIFVADLFNTVKESNENNNGAQTQITVQP